MNIKELVSIVAVLAVALLINDVVLNRLSKPPAPAVHPVEVPDTDMVVPVQKKQSPPPKKITKAPSEVECMASVVFHEARGEPELGQLAVASVVLNRVKSRHYPRSVCKVVFQPHQFTDHNKIKYNKKTLRLAKKLMQGAIDKVTDATHFHSIHVMPKWASDPRMVYLGQIGDHLFYKMG